MSGLKDFKMHLKSGVEVDGCILKSFLKKYMISANIVYDVCGFRPPSVYRWIKTGLPTDSSNILLKNIDKIMETSLSITDDQHSFLIKKGKTITRVMIDIESFSYSTGDNDLNVSINQDMESSLNSGIESSSYNIPVRALNLNIGFIVREALNFHLKNDYLDINYLITDHINPNNRINTRYVELARMLLRLKKVEMAYFLEYGNKNSTKRALTSMYTEAIKKKKMGRAKSFILLKKLNSLL